jgi:hypothetical protein
MTSHPPANPDDYPHTLRLEGDRVLLVTSHDGTVVFRDLGSSPTLQGGYACWKHLLDDHDRNHANVYLWGFMNGLSATLVKEMDAMVRSVKADLDKL